MRYFFSITLLVLTLTTNSNAQDSTLTDTSWNKGGQFIFTFSQASFNDWAAGGDNSYSGNSRLGLFANYASGKVKWSNSLDLAYGLSKVGEQHFRKSDDIIELNSKFGYQAKNKWFYSGLFNVKTQFAEGRKYSGIGEYEVVSDFMGPFTTSFAVGADYNPNKHTAIFISPLNSRFLFVQNDSLLKYNSLEAGEHFRYELGFIAKLNYKKEIIKNVNLESKFDVFADYLSFNDFEEGEGFFTNVDYNWEVLITTKIFKIISVNLNTHLIWDNDTKDSDGNAKLQFKEIFGAGLSYKF